MAALATLPLLVLGAGALLRPVAFPGADAGPRSTPGADRPPALSGPPAGAPTSLAAAAATRSPKPVSTPRGTPSVRPGDTPARTSTPSRRAPRTLPPTAGRPAPAPPPAGTAPAAGSVEEQVVTLVNRERAANGCPAVAPQPQLAEAARRHSEDQAEHDTMSHTGSDGSSPWDRAERAGYTRAIGENVAAGYRTADAVMTGWMNSDGHRANILNCEAKAIGVGVATAGDGTMYWTQMFGAVV